tara:strand:- start:1321 stop:1629 length:309 start_codon:yes stop_codon:yes gene_type:complete
MHSLLDSEPIKYKVGDVDIEINHTHENKLRILKMQMDNWAHNSAYRNMSLDSMTGRRYDEDVKRVEKLFGMLKASVVKNLTKYEMREMNILFKRYGGTRKKK